MARKTPNRGRASRERNSADEKETADRNGAAGKGIVNQLSSANARKATFLDFLIAMETAR
jgi:hypothetical protein